MSGNTSSHSPPHPRARLEEPSSGCLPLSTHSQGFCYMKMEGRVEGRQAFWEMLPRTEPGSPGPSVLRVQRDESHLV